MARVIRPQNWPLWRRLLCLALHAPAVDVTATYNPKSTDVLSTQCPDCRRIYWRFLTAREQEAKAPAAPPRRPGETPWSKIECA